MAKELIDSIIDIQAIEKQISVVTKGLDTIISKMSNVQGSSVDIAKQFGDAATIKDIESAIKRLNAENEKARKLNEQAKKKAEELTIAERQLAQAKKEQIRIAELEAKSTNQQISAYERLSAQLTLNRTKYKNLVAQGKENTEQAKSLRVEIEKQDTALKELDASVGQHQRNVGNYKSTVTSVRQEMRDLNIIIANAKINHQENTEEIIKAKQRLGELKDAIADTSMETKLLGSDTQKLDMAVGVFKGIGSAAQVAEASMQLLGSENEDVQKGIQRLVAIQSVLNGVQEIGNALQKESAFMMGLLAAKTWLMVKAQAAWNAVKSLGAGGLTLLIAGVTALAAGLFILFNRTNEQTEAQKDLNKEMEDYDKINRRINSELETRLRLEKAAGEDERRLLDIRTEAKKKELDGELKNIEAIRKRLLTAEFASEKEFQIELEIFSKRIDIANKLNKEYEDLETQRLEFSIQAGNAFAEKAEQKDKENKDKQLKRQQEFDDILDNYNKKVLERRQYIYNRIRNDQKTGMQEDADFEKRLKAYLTDFSIKKKEEEKEKFKNAEREMDSFMWQLRFQTINTLSSLTDAYYQNQINKIDQLSRKDQEAKEKELSRKNLTDAQKDAIEAKYDRISKKREEERQKLTIKQARFNKLFSAMNVGLSTSQAIMSIWADITLPTIAKPALTAIAAAIGALQLASVLAQPIPKYAKGRKGGKEELAIVGESGAEAIVKDGKTTIVDKPTLTVLPAGADVISNPELQRMNIANDLKINKGQNNRNDFVSLELSKSVNALTREVKNMKQLNVNVDGNGINVWSNQGKQYVKYIDGKFRS